MPNRKDEFPEDLIPNEDDQEVQINIPVDEDDYEEKLRLVEDNTDDDDVKELEFGER